MNRAKSFNLIKGAVACALALTVFTGCSTIKRSPVPSSVYNIPDQYQDKMSEQLDATGFQQGWIGDPALIAKYNKVMLDPQISSSMIENSTLENFTTYRIFSSQDDANNYMLNYAQSSFNNAFASSTSFQVATQPGPDTLKISFYITQVVPGDAVIGGLGNISSLTPIGLIILPIKVMIKGESRSNGGAIASETVITDSVTGQVLAVFLDREKGTTSLFNTEEFTVFGGSRAAVNAWTTDLASTLDQIKQGQKDLSAPVIVPTWKWFN